jgi:hypothetical protein
VPLQVTRSGVLVLARGSGVLETSDVSMLTDAIDARVAMGAPFLVVGDALSVESVSPAARRFLGDHRNAKQSQVGALDLGLVLALRSPVVRGAMTAISWFSGAFADLRTVDRRTELAVVARAVLVTKQTAIAAIDDAALERFVTSA